MGNILTASSGYIDVLKFSTPDQIDFEFDQVRMMQKAQMAGIQTFVTMLTNSGVIATGSSGPGFSGLAPWGQAPAFWMGLSNFFAVSAFIVIPGMIFLLVFLYISGKKALIKWVAYFVLFFWFAELLLYYSGFGNRYIATDRNFIWSLLFSVLVSTVMVIVV